MDLDEETARTLRNVRSIHKPTGFHSADEIREFWHQKNGARGFLNIKEITPQMVAEIRNKIINKPKAGV